MSSSLLPLSVLTPAAVRSGIFAPALFMGGMLGGAVDYLGVIVFHHSADSIGAFAVVGMGPSLPESFASHDHGAYHL